ncbi:ATP-binding protein [Streptomyces sp. NBC_00424]|uniref:ATP-binding protein n=1 Tax=Streptomyces sp. NBC_00424 TaxID=2903648 RepID=UPI0022575793|nr:ATP-binding protein [Streptomyces sp. NBC_00424]MCX5078991.1 ATP-binding protein [Streptomyces sp. NBC_00424]
MTALSTPLYPARIPARATITGGAEFSFLRCSDGEPSTQDRQRPRQSRVIAAAFLRLWGLAPLTDPACLALSELVTNAFVHGRGASVTVRLFLTAAELCIEVCDGSPWVSRQPSPDPLAPSGRGLSLVDAVVDAWGVCEDGARVWCLIRRDLGTPEGHR